MKSYLRLGTEVYSDLMLAASVGNLCHLDLDLQPFTGVDPLGRVRFGTAKDQLSRSATNHSVVMLSDTEDMSTYNYCGGGMVTQKQGGRDRHAGSRCPRDQGKHLCQTNQ